MPTIEFIKKGKGKRYPKKGDLVTIHFSELGLDDWLYDTSRFNEHDYYFELGSKDFVRVWSWALP